MSRIIPNPAPIISQSLPEYGHFAIFQDHHYQENDSMESDHPDLMHSRHHKIVINIATRIYSENQIINQRQTQLFGLSTLLGFTSSAR